MPSLFQVLSSGPLKVSIVGSGNWGSVVARLVAENAKRSHLFKDEVKMWVFEEMIDGKKLTDIINEIHENVKYLPGHKLPPNLIATNDVVDACRDSELLIFVIPHQFLEKVCDKLVSENIVKKGTRAISLMKGFHIHNGYPIRLSKYIEEKLNIKECSVLSGANVANDIATESFSECTIGFRDAQNAFVWQLLFDKPYFKVECIPDAAGVEVSGALKNIIALAAGFCDGLDVGSSTKAAIIRIGINEMKNFEMLFFDGILSETFLNSAGLADVIATVYGGRNSRVAAEFVRHRGKKPWDDLEAEMLNGQKLQGTLTAKEIYEVIEKHNLEEKFPLFVTTYRIAFENQDPKEIVDIFTCDDYRDISSLKECTYSTLPFEFLPITQSKDAPIRNYDQKYLKTVYKHEFEQEDIKKME